VKQRSPESGYILIVILIAVTLMSIALAAAVPALKTQIRREQEIELQHRGKEYIKAIQKYYHKFGRYPASIEQLENTNNLRYLRKRYKDPITGKDDWRIIHLGEAKYPPKIKGLNGAQVGQQIGQNIGTAIGQNVGTAPAGTASTNPGDQSPSSGPGYPSPTSGPTDQTSPLGSPQLGAQTTGPGASSTPSSNVGQSGQPMIGVAIPKTTASLKRYNQREKYNEWEFIYDPRIEQLRNGGLGGVGVPGNTNTPGTNTPGTNSPGTTQGNSPGFSLGPSPSQPPSTTPQ
jgi:type II secretory pathway pseudopilin PulG